jgi:hypothetical protein
MAAAVIMAMSNANTNPNPYEFKPFRVPVWADDDCDCDYNSDDSDDPEQIIQYIVLKYNGVNRLKPHIDKIPNLICLGNTCTAPPNVKEYLDMNHMHNVAVFKAPPAVCLQSFNGIRQEINSILGSLMPYVCQGSLELNIISFDGPYAIATVI